MVSSGRGRVSVIAREALVIDCDFLLQLLFSKVSPKASDGTSYSYAIIQMEMVLGNIWRESQLQLISPKCAYVLDLEIVAIKT